MKSIPSQIPCRCGKKCCEKCYSNYTEHTWPAHTVYDACINQACECHAQCMVHNPPLEFVCKNKIHTNGICQACRPIINLTRDVSANPTMPKNDAIYVETLESRIDALEEWRDKVKNQLL
jgi:hypothetical protein